MILYEEFFRLVSLCLLQNISECVILFYILQKFAHIGQNLPNSDYNMPKGFL